MATPIYAIKENGDLVFFKYAIAAECDKDLLDYLLGYRGEKRLDHWLSSSTRGRLYAALREGPKSTAELKALGFESPGSIIGHLRRSSIVQDDLAGQIDLVEFNPLTPNGKPIKRYALFDDDTPDDFLYYGVPDSPV